MKDETTYTENTLDMLGITYQRLRSCSSCVDHSAIESLLLDNIEDALNIGLYTTGFNEILDTLGKLYQRVASVNNGRTSEGKGPHLKVLALIQEILEKQL